MTCLRKSRFSTGSADFVFATGGKENDLKVWSLNDEQPIFRAKNMADNWMQLREPVWIMSIDFLDEKRVVVGTAHHQVRKIYNFQTSTPRLKPRDINKTNISMITGGILLTKR